MYYKQMRAWNQRGEAYMRDKIVVNAEDLK